MLKDIQLENLFKLLATNSPSGSESEVSKYLKLRMKGICDVYTDVIGNTYMHTGCDRGLKIMITSHCDEVSFQVTRIDENGYVYFRSVSFPDRQTICGQKVSLNGKNGALIGVVGKKSPHVMKMDEEQHVPDFSNLWIDFGFSNISEAEEYLSIGDYFTVHSVPNLNFNRTKIISKGLDNKICVFVLSELMDLLTQENLSASITGVATVQEEVGYRGAIVASRRVSPDIAFCLDVGIATDIPSMSSINDFGRLNLGMGPGISINPENNPALISLLKDVATKNKINIQSSVGYRPVRGTETGPIQLSNMGIATSLISIPNRYMHSPIEMCDLTDVSDAIQLLFESIRKIQNLNKSYFVPW